MTNVDTAAIWHSYEINTAHGRADRIQALIDSGDLWGLAFIGGHPDYDAHKAGWRLLFVTNENDAEIMLEVTAD